MKNLLKHPLFCLVFFGILAACSSPTSSFPLPQTTPTPTAALPSATVQPTIIPAVTPELTLPVRLGTALPEFTGPLSINNAASMKEVAAYGEGNVYASVFSPQGDILAVASGGGVDILDAADLKLRCRFANSYAEHLAFNASGDRLILAESGKSIVLIIDPATCKLDHQIDLIALTGERYLPNIYYLSADGQALAFGFGGDHFCKKNKNSPAVWLVNPLLNTAEGVLANNSDCNLIAFDVALSADQKTIYTLSMTPGDTKSRLEAWAKASRTRLWETDAGSNLLAISSDQKWVAGASDNILMVWTGDGRLAWKADFDGQFSGFEFTADDKLLVITSRDLMILNPEDGSVLFTLAEKEDFTILAVNPDGSRVATYSDKGVSIWDLADKSRIASRQDYYGIPLKINIAPMRDWVGVTFKNTSGILDLSRGVFMPDSVGTGVISFSLDGSMLAHATLDNRLEVLSLPDFTPLSIPSISVYGSFFSPDGKTLAVIGYEESIIRLLDTSSWEITAVIIPDWSDKMLGAHEQKSIWAGYSPDGRWLYSQFGRYLNIWSTVDYSLQLSLTNSTNSRYVDWGNAQMKKTKSDPTFLPDSETFFWIEEDPLSDNIKRLSLYNILNGTLVNPSYLPMSGRGYYFPMALSADGQLLAIHIYGFPYDPGTQGEIQLWDWSKKKFLTSTKFLSGSINDMRFSADGRFLIVATADGIIRVYGVVK